MDAYLYRAGELVGFRADARGTAAASGAYRIISRLPLRDGEPSYRIKSELERHDRVARESELREP